MKIPKAIEIQNDYIYDGEIVDSKDLIDAIKLGNEALKIFLKMRAEGCTFFNIKLPGED